MIRDRKEQKHHQQYLIIEEEPTDLLSLFILLKLLSNAQNIFIKFFFLFFLTYVCISFSRVCSFIIILQDYDNVNTATSIMSILYLFKLIRRIKNFFCQNFAFIWFFARHNLVYLNKVFNMTTHMWMDAYRISIIDNLLNQHSMACVLIT